MVRDLGLESSDGGAAFPAKMRAHPAHVALAWMIGGLATIAAVILGSILAVVFAATLAFALVLAAVFVTVLAVAWRFRRPHPIEHQPVMEARKLGHSWVAYGWDQQP